MMVVVLGHLRSNEELYDPNLLLRWLEYAFISLRMRWLDGQCRGCWLCNLSLLLRCSIFSVVLHGRNGNAQSVDPKGRHPLNIHQYDWPCVLWLCF